MKQHQAKRSNVGEALRAASAALGKEALSKAEPSWEQWVAPLNLAPAIAQSLIESLRHLSRLPFADKTALANLLLFRYARLPQIREETRPEDLERRRLSSFFELLVDMALQGNSVFPQNPTHLAQQVQQVLEAPVRPKAQFDVLVDLVISKDGAARRSGFNFPQVVGLAQILEYEHDRREGTPEWCWKAPHKYDLYAAEVKQASEFHEDWRLLAKEFRLDRFRDEHDIIRRSPLMEGNWRKPSFSDLKHEGNRFQVAFDFFCWKWFLYGMKGDEPLVQKLAVTLTPFGTQIFIPGFWSLDPARDINWTKITRLHRARGIAKQGEKLLENQKARMELVKRVAQADKAARAQKFKGQRRYRFIKESAGLVEITDDAEVRRYLREAKSHTP